MITFHIRMEVEVDEAAWLAEYGTPASDSRGVEDYILNALVQSPAAEVGALTVTGYAVRG